MDNFDGFSGLGCAGIQFLRDEYASKPSLCFACQPPQLPQSSVKADSLRVLNQALALSSLSESCSLFVPVSGATQAWRQPGAAVSLPHVTYRVRLFSYWVNRYCQATCNWSKVTDLYFCEIKLGAAKCNRHQSHALLVTVWLVICT